MVRQLFFDEREEVDTQNFRDEKNCINLPRRKEEEEEVMLMDQHVKEGLVR